MGNRKAGRQTGLDSAGRALCRKGEKLSLHGAICGALVSAACSDQPVLGGAGERQRQGIIFEMLGSGSCKGRDAARWSACFWPSTVARLP